MDNVIDLEERLSKPKTWPDRIWGKYYSSDANWTDYLLNIPRLILLPGSLIKKESDRNDLPRPVPATEAERITRIGENLDDLGQGFTVLTLEFMRGAGYLAGGYHLLTKFLE